MTITAKDLIGQIITLAERLDAQDKIIVQDLAPTMGVLHDRLEALETPKVMRKTGDEVLDALIDELNAQHEINEKLTTKLRDLEGQLDEVLSHLRKDGTRLGRSISLDRMSR